MAYGIDVFNARNPLAWPGDEGINFSRLLLDRGVAARCRENPGTCHAVEIMPVICPDISHATVSDIATFVTSL
jgi:acetyl esterase